jgi:dienelactone hydrolase
MRRRLKIGICIVILLIIALPVGIKQLVGEESRSFQVVKLEDTVYKEVSFQNPSQNIKLGGMLFIPDGDGPFPAAVIIQGSGASRRDRNWNLTLAQYLQTNGVVILIPDKRGCDQSEGNWQTASFEDLATDTLAAISYIKNQNDVTISPIGVIGMSQGGWIAPIVVDNSKDISFLVSFSGAAVTTHEQLLYEVNYNLRQLGFLPGISNLIAFPSTLVLTEISQKELWDAIGNFDPIPYWERITTRCLVLLGREDTNVPAEESEVRLRSLNKSNIDVKVYEGSGHGLEDPVEVGDKYIRDDVLLDILNFINTPSKLQ